MSDFDYEIRGYVVEWKIGNKTYKQNGFDTEESAKEFAKEKLKEFDSVTLIQERYAIGWWK